MDLSKIVNGFKIKTGRQLSIEQMENAKSSMEKPASAITYIQMNGNTRIELSRDGKPVDMIQKLPNGDYARLQQFFTWMETDDISHRNIKHQGYYPDETVDSLYDSEGRLKRKMVVQGGIYNDTFSKPVSKVYEPAGRMIGSKL